MAGDKTQRIAEKARPTNTGVRCPGDKGYRRDEIIAPLTPDNAHTARSFYKRNPGAPGTILNHPTPSWKDYLVRATAVTTATAAVAVDADADAVAFALALAPLCSAIPQKQQRSRLPGGGGGVGGGSGGGDRGGEGGEEIRLAKDRGSQDIIDSRIEC
ncbi:hypothetical protein HZH66_003130 [Vespula vulgaris]|uniref:Uncharacterized protein n=1 Tax=Vespula vulgaris TaxID=7454 RepID=A0A834KKZ7_VESVU|nr:hypothetical protein HZH66_003130 [Vespula vulgaris]